MADRRSKTGKAGDRPDPEAPRGPGAGKAGEQGREATAAGTPGGTGDEEPRRILPEEMEPLDAERVGPDPAREAGLSSGAATEIEPASAPSAPEDSVAAPAVPQQSPDPVGATSPAVADAFPAGQTSSPSASGGARADAAGSGHAGSVAGRSGSASDAAALSGSADGEIGRSGYLGTDASPSGDPGSEADRSGFLGAEDEQSPPREAYGAPADAPGSDAASGAGGARMGDAPAPDASAAASAAAASAAAGLGERRDDAAAKSASADRAAATPPQLDAPPEPAAAGPADRGITLPDAQHDEAPEEAHDDTGGRSLAGMALAALLLLLAGAALGIWAAPRLAPHLPAGMAPVAAWLTPGADRLDQRIASLEEETAAALAGLGAELERVEAEAAATASDPAASDARLAELDARLAELESDLAGRIGGLEDNLAALDGGETRDRLSRLETVVEGQQETLAALRDQLAEVDVAGEATAQIDAYQAELAGMRGEVRGIAGQVGVLSRRIDEVAAQAQQQVEFARAQVAEIEAEAATSLTRAEIEADLATIRSALASGTPFEDAAARLAEQLGAELPQPLAELAPEGVPTMASLQRDFSDAATRAIRAEVQTRADDTALGRLRGFAQAQVATRSLQPRPGDDADAVLSRVEHALGQNDLETALAEAEALPAEAAEAMSDWLAAARARLAAAAGYEQLQAELSATN